MNKKPYSFHIDCTAANGREIQAMTETAQEISWETFRNKVGINQLKQLFPNYSWDSGSKGLHLKDDYAVSFYESTYKGMPCYYIEHSAIEYVFTRD